LRTNRLRSGLTVLGVVIGITAIVGMTSLIRGFDQSLRDSIRALGPDTIFLAKFSGLSLAAGEDFAELARRPNLTVDDARAVERLSPSVGVVDIWLGASGDVTERVFYRGERTKPLVIFGATDEFATVNFVQLSFGRFFTQPEVEHRRRVVVLGDTAYQALFGPLGLDPVGRRVRLGAVEFTVVGVLGKRPSAGGVNTGADDFVVIPQTTHQILFGTQAQRGFRGQQGSAMIAIVPREGASREDAMDEARQVMRIRHRLKVDDPDDFDMVTQDAALRVWDQVSRATFLALVVISSIALMVGGIGVMAIMMISVTERTREIGIRKALGARRRELLLQFLAESVVLTSVGGILGIVLGSTIGLSVNLLTGFPISLPWWSFALGLGFSAAVGIFFGMVPAARAARMDPIEALRHE
ncbi:MAG: FtsX-like permease family protein, partial [Acidobacteria bacterium]|nr:FtsX-like permease family protein [Acidobacteriota bacterium]